MVTQGRSSDFRPSTPLSIPRQQTYMTPSRVENISALLAETRIPRRFPKNRRKASYNSTSSSGTPPRSLSDGFARSSLFSPDPQVDTSVAGSHSFLLTPPNSFPTMARSFSIDSIASENSTSSSQHSRTTRIISAHREEVDLAIDDPLHFEGEEGEEGSVEDEGDDERSVGRPESSSSRRTSLGALFRPLRNVAPSISASALVSSLSANLTAWAASLAASHLDDDYGLLPSSSLACPHPRHHHAVLPPRSTAAHDSPRPVRASGPLKNQSTIIDVEMERPLLAEQPMPIFVELLPWAAGNSSTTAAGSQVQTPTQLRGREPRMNPDFLRILVLESNMRRLGKIAPGTGRARMILSPRCGDQGSSQLHQCLTV